MKINLLRIIEDEWKNTDKNILIVAFGSCYLGISTCLPEVAFAGMEPVNNYDGAPVFIWRDIARRFISAGGQKNAS